jgi:BirA family transcriptional regulator, biotin operon repressor / biotin---[acetyl-CoA-carboxylase] ligase
VGKNVVYVPECHSTNTLAAQLSQNSTASEGTVVITHHQTAGRGQRGSVWKTEPGVNLTISIIIKPGSLLVKHQFYLNIVTALAVRDMLLETLNIDISIKWPNDILVHNKKICGILIENQLQGQLIENSVVGIGINVNQVVFEIATATSMQNIAKQPFALQEIFDRLLGRFEARYILLKQNRLTELRQLYLKHLFQRGEVKQYEANGVEFSGEIVAIDEDGRLAVNVDNQMKYFQVKEIRYL